MLLGGWCGVLAARCSVESRPAFWLQGVMNDVLLLMRLLCQARPSVLPTLHPTPPVLLLSTVALPPDPLPPCAGLAVLLRGANNLNPASTASHVSHPPRFGPAVLLRGANDYMLDEMDRSLHDAFCVIKRVLESGEVVPGGQGGKGESGWVDP